MSRKSVTVLGCGRVGTAIVFDLAKDPSFRVRAVDADQGALERVARRAPNDAELETMAADLSDPDVVSRMVGDVDVAVGAVPGDLGFETLEAVLQAGRPVVDISFFEEDAFRLDGLAREARVPALVDAGLAPGLSNLVLGRCLEDWDVVESFECLVGGLPEDRSAPFEYRAPFSPLDVLAEYTRPARVRREGERVTLPALSEVERVEVPGLGTLEAFLTDGLRTLLDTTDVPDMVEKTMRYPGHARAMRELRETGFFSQEPVDTEGGPVRPFELTGRLLSRAWHMDADHEDLVVMRITVEGRDDGAPVRRRWWLVDRYDPDTGTTAMARTTGYTCTACVRLLAAGRYGRPGISPLETVGRDPACHEFLVSRLAERGLSLQAEAREGGPGG